MKHLTEYRDPEIVRHYLEAIRNTVKQTWTIMEICGGQTHSLVKNGLLELLPPEVNMVHGPGCPVCVTPISIIDQAVSLSMQPNVILCSYGDMLRVPGSQMSLLEAKALGADIRILYSPLEAVQLARQYPDKEVVFFAVGFETTAPANALSVKLAKEQQVTNYSILSSHVLVPPAIEAIMNDTETRVQAFLAAGHVCAIMGLEAYEPIVANYRIPIVVTGFEPVDLLQGIFMVVKQLENGEAKLENQYSRIVPFDGNPNAREIIAQTFQLCDREWRGLGRIPMSGLELHGDLSQFDANRRFHLVQAGSNESTSCIAGAIMKGLKKPQECPEFGHRCRPENPIGAPMVSSEGSCAAYYNYFDFETSTKT